MRRNNFKDGSYDQKDSEHSLKGYFPNLFT